MRWLSLTILDYLIWRDMQDLWSLDLLREQAPLTWQTTLCFGHCCAILESDDPAFQSQALPQYGHMPAVPGPLCVTKHACILQVPSPTCDLTHTKGKPSLPLICRCTLEPAGAAHKGVSALTSSFHVTVLVLILDQRWPLYAIAKGSGHLHPVAALSFGVASCSYVIMTRMRTIQTISVKLACPAYAPRRAVGRRTRVTRRVRKDARDGSLGNPGSTREIFSPNPRECSMLVSCKSFSHLLPVTAQWTSARQSSMKQRRMATLPRPHSASFEGRVSSSHSASFEGRVSSSFSRLHCKE